MESLNLCYEFALVFGITITAVIILLLIKQRPLYLHHRLLLAFFVIVLALFFNYYADHHRIYWLFVATNFLTTGIGFLVGPLIYFYIQSLFASINFKDLTVWLFFLPFLIIWLLVPLPLSLQNPQEGLIFSYLAIYFEHIEFFYLLETLYLLFFTILSLRLLTRYTAAMKAYFSSISRADILWSRRLLLGLLLYLAVELGFTLIRATLGAFPAFEMPFSVFITLLVVLYLGYFGFFQSQMLIPAFLLDKQVSLETNAEKTQLIPTISNFSPKEIDQTRQVIQQVLTNEKLYLKIDLTLSDLATAVGLTDKKLSTFINQELNTNFYELINGYRINAFKKALVDRENKHLTIWGIANQCGFKAKTSFNRTFKKQTGLTPSQYQKQLANRPI